MSTLLRRAAVAGMGITTAVGVMALPALTASSSAAPAVLHSSSSATVRGITARPMGATSTLIAGYAGSATISTLTAKFKAPAINCANVANTTTDTAFGTYAWTSAGIGVGYDAAANIQPDCESGTLDYAASAFTVGGGNDYNFTVSAGDSITATITESGGTTTATLDDSTTGDVYTSTESATADAFWSHGLLNYNNEVPNFTGAVQKDKVNGTALGSAGGTKTALDQNGIDKQVTASKVLAGSTKLTLTFKNNS